MTESGGKTSKFGRNFGPSDRDRTCGLMVPNGPMKAISTKNSFFRPFPLGKPRSSALLSPLFPSAPKRQVVCYVVSRDFCTIIRNTRLSLSRERRLLLCGCYNSEQPLIQVKICTAVDKDKEINIFCSLNNCSTMSKKIF